MITKTNALRPSCQCKAFFRNPIIAPCPNWRQYISELFHMKNGKHPAVVGKFDIKVGPTNIFQ
jgi:hypothetical protein